MSLEDAIQNLNDEAEARSLSDRCMLAGARLALEAAAWGADDGDLLDAAARLRTLFATSTTAPVLEIARKR
jgi:hypothetical protein